MKDTGGHATDFAFKSTETYDKRVAVRNSCYTDNISWLPSTYKTNALIGVDPLFVDAANGNFTCKRALPVWIPATPSQEASAI